MAAFRPNNPPPSSAITQLAYIGPLFGGRFRRVGIRTLRDLLNRLKRARDTRASTAREKNRAFLARMLRNPRAKDCVGKRRYYGRKYEVRDVNKWAWNSIVTYARRRGVPRGKLPGVFRQRTRRRAFPPQCN